MHAYIDETGNTGHNLFDESQPIFWIGAMMTPHDFDVCWANEVQQVMKDAGVDQLHATKIGSHGIERIAKPLKKILMNAGAKFYICRIAKRDMAAFKFFDTIFDPGENKAISFHHYNIRPLRLLLLGKVYYLLDEELLKKFWGILLNKKENHGELIEVLTTVYGRVHHLPDKRSQQLVRDAMEWAIDHPDEITASSYSKETRQMHMPNMVGFIGLVRGIHEQSVAWKTSVESIKHDRQDQFRKSLADWHKIFSNADAGTIKLPFEGEVGMRLVPGSKFFIESDSTPSLDVIDVALWLVQRYTSGESFTGACERLRRFVMSNTRWYDQSIANVQRMFQGDMLKVGPVTMDRINPAFELRDKMGRARLARMG